MTCNLKLRLRLLGRRAVLARAAIARVVSSQIIRRLLAIAVLFAAGMPGVFADVATLTPLVSFYGANGAVPVAAITRGSDGNFYGTTAGGGSGGFGTVFKVTPAGVLTTIATFDYTNGAESEAALVQAGDGNFYGTTLSGGDYGLGAAFKVSPAGELTRLVSFTGANGSSPQGNLIQASDGNFYGTAPFGGDYGSGLVFKITPGGELTTLYSFGGQDGRGPYAGVVQGDDGNFYGTTTFGGAYDWGTIFKLTPYGELTTLFTFDGGDNLGAPEALMKGADGNFYGTAQGGITVHDGSVFRITPAGDFKTLAWFDGTDGSGPYGAILRAGDGNFYGTTALGGVGDMGTVFRLTPGGELTTLVNFGNDDCPYACYTWAGLAQGDNGDLYGTTVGPGLGAIYKVAVNATPSNLTASTGNAQVTLNWIGSINAVSYNVYQSATAGFNPAAPVATGITTTTATISGLNNATTYYFVIAAINQDGSESFSNEATAIMPAPPPQVTGLSAIPGNSHVQLSWSAASSASSYNVYQGTASGAEVLVGSGLTSPSFTAGSLTNGVPYFFKVSAANDIGTGPISAEVEATPIAPASSPAFSPPPGRYLVPQMVTISDSTPGTTIYYTTDGSTPTTGSLRYTGPVKVTASETLRAYAIAPGYLPSAVSAGSYTIVLHKPSR